MTTHKIDPNQREDLRNVYLKIHGSAIVTEIPEVAAELGLKPRYVKELVEVLANHADRDDEAFAVINRRAGEENNDGPNDWWQTSKTVDNHTDEEAAAWFDEHFPKTETKVTQTSAPRTPRNATNPADLPECRCACGEICNRGRNYRPGHDARHAGMVGRGIGQLNPTQDDLQEQIDLFLGTLPTKALQDKAYRIGSKLLADQVRKAEKLMEGAAQDVKAKVAKAEANTVPLADVLPKAKADYVKGKSEPILPVEEIDGVVKVGRWVHKAKQNSVSKAVRYTKKNNPDVWHVATDREAASFVPNED